jgi:hypothetical protein
MNLKFQISNFKFAACGVAVISLIVGCIGKHPSNPAATQPVTVKDLATTQPSYWLDKPAAVTVSNFQFQPLWDACEKTARAHLFQLDREDYRLGLLTTKPMISKQLLEPWRKDTGTAHGVVENSLAAIRRTLRFEIEHSDDGTYIMTPKVIVERFTIVERRITSATQTRVAFSGPQVPTREAVEAETADLPVSYWTPVGRDSEMEKQVAAEVRKRL